jgi:hypothetical protein
MKTLCSILALFVAGGAASAQDKPKPRKEDDSVQKEVDKRLKAQSDEILRAVEKLLDERLGRSPKPEPKETPKKGMDPSQGGDHEKTLKEVDKRLKAQRDEILRAVGKMLDERMGKGKMPPENKPEPGKKGYEGRGPFQGGLPPGLAMQRGHLPPGLAKRFGPGKNPKMEHKKKDEDPRKKKKGKEDHDRDD